MVGNLQCPSCIEAKRARPAPVASLKEIPTLFQILGMDCFEFEHAGFKHTFLLMRDRASGYVMLQFLQTYTGTWEPATENIIAAVCRWLMVNPKPQWVITDSATYFTSNQMLEFYGNSGVGVLTTPAEAHEMLGAEEGCKEFWKRLRCAFSERIRLGHEHPSACSPCSQWGHRAIGIFTLSVASWRRWSRRAPARAEPEEDVCRLLRLKEKAKVAFEMEPAKDRLSKLNNSAGRPPQSFKPGDLLMLWRQKNKPGKVSGTWVGPVRLLLQEGPLACHWINFDPCTDYASPNMHKAWTLFIKTKSHHGSEGD